MFSFGNPKILFLLLLIPAFLCLFILQRRLRIKNLRKFGDLNLLKSQMPMVSDYTPWIRISLMLLAIAVIVVILARPRVRGNSTLNTKKVQGSEVVVAIDISNSMLASSTDSEKGVSRLQRTKFIVEKLFEKIADDKVGLVVFAGDAYVQMPITNDFSSAKLFLNSLSTDLVGNQGTAIGSAIEESTSLFSNDKKCQKSIILITDAENHEDDAIAMAKEAQKFGIEINVVGVGTGTPMPIRLKDGTYMTFDGQIVKTACDEKAASEIAKIGKGVYVTADNSDAVNILSDQLNKAKKTNMDKKVFSPADEQFPVFSWLALVLLITECMLSNKKISWLTKTNFFGK